MRLSMALMSMMSSQSSESSNCLSVHRLLTSHNGAKHFVNGHCFTQYDVINDFVCRQNDSKSESAMLRATLLSLLTLGPLSSRVTNARILGQLKWSTEQIN